MGEEYLGGYGGATHVVVAQHDSFGLARGPRGVDERAALVGFLAGDDGFQQSVGFIAAQSHELCPLKEPHNHQIHLISRKTEEE